MKASSINLFHAIFLIIFGLSDFLTDSPNDYSSLFLLVLGALFLFFNYSYSDNSISASRIRSFLFFLRILVIIFSICFLLIPYYPKTYLDNLFLIGAFVSSVLSLYSYKKIS